MTSYLKKLHTMFWMHGACRRIVLDVSPSFRSCDECVIRDRNTNTTTTPPHQQSNLRSGRKMEEFLFPIFRFDSTCHPELIETTKPFYKKVMTLGEKIGTGTHIKLYQFDSSIIEITIRTTKNQQQASSFHMESEVVCGLGFIVYLQ